MYRSELYQYRQPEGNVFIQCIVMNYTSIDNNKVMYSFNVS